MRKSLIALLVLLALAVGLLTAATAVINQQETAVVITEDRHYGDPAAGEGLDLRVLTTMEGYLHWDTVIDLGSEIAWTTDFRYTASRESIPREPQPYLNLYTSSGNGTSTTYEGDLELGESGDPFDAVLADVATRAPAGTAEYRETVRLADYMDYYPLAMDYSLTFDSEDYYYNEGYYWPGGDGPWQEVSEFFHLPVGDDVITVDISKGQEGNVYSAGWEQTDGPTFSSTAAVAEGGAYLAVWDGYDDVTGLAKPLPEEAAETGVYWMPIVVGEPDEYGYMMPQVDVDNIQLLWQPEEGVCEGLTLVDDGARLLAQVNTEDGEFMSVVDTATGETLQTFPLDYRPDGWTWLFVEEDYVATMNGSSAEQPDGTYAPSRQWVEAWYAPDGGTYEKVISCDTVAGGIQWNYDVQTWCDGERLVLAALVESWNDPGVDLVICDGQGLQYAARLNHSQAWDPEPSKQVRPDTSVAVEADG